MEPRVDTMSLIRKAQGGDRASFDAVVEGFLARIEKYLEKEASAQLQQRVELGDLVQETFLRAWQSMRGFHGSTDTAFGAWLRTIALHVVQMEARKLKAKKRAPKAEVSLAEPIRTPHGGFEELVDLLKRSSATSPSAAARRDERFERLQRALDSLSPEHREVILLARIQELQMGEVARRMGRSAEAVSMLLYRALLKLKEAFGTTESCHLPDRRLGRGGDGR